MGYETRSDGYCRVREWVPSEGRERYVYVHQLTVIADGADPSDVFNDGETHVHHENGLKYDNRPENLTVIDAATHAKQPGHIASD